MSWKKIAHILDPQVLAPQTNGWLKTHCSIPIAHHLQDDIFRIYFYGRNDKNQSQIGFAEIDLNDPTKILNLTEKPVFEVGPKGHFDESGVMPCCMLTPPDKPDEIWLYYTGWIQGVTVPLYVYTGLAISRDQGLTFERFSPAPIMPRHRHDPILNGSTSILIENGIYRNWFISGTRWIETDNPAKPKHFYNVAYAESPDGIDWSGRQGHRAIDFKDSEEYAIARPWVIKEDDLYKIWFSYRGGPNLYRIGYAESTDGITWNRQDDHPMADIQPSSDPNAWDSDMICYSQVFNHNDKKYMLYNGNNYGYTGMGLAIFEN